MKNIGLLKKRNTINWDNRLKYFAGNDVLHKQFLANTKRGYPIFKATCSLEYYGRIEVHITNQEGNEITRGIQLEGMAQFFTKKNIDKLKWHDDNKFECFLLIRANGSNTVAEIFTREETLKERYEGEVELFGLKGIIATVKKQKTD